MFEIPKDAVEGFFIGPDIQVRSYMLPEEKVPFEFYTGSKIRGAGKFYEVSSQYEAGKVANMRGSERIRWAQERDEKKIDGRHFPRRRKVADWSRLFSLGFLRREIGD